jgi:hypothetical protein
VPRRAESRGTAPALRGGASFTGTAPALRGGASLLVLALLAGSCREGQELFPEAGDASAGLGSASATAFHLISIGANAQDAGIEDLSGLGAALILRDDQLLFWGNGGGTTTGRGFSIAVVDPRTHALVGSVETFDTFATRESGGGEATRLAAFLDGIANGMLVLAVIGDDAGLNENGVGGEPCAFLDDAGTQAALDRMAQLGSTELRRYCYRASWAMAAYKGTGRAEAEELIDGEPAHVSFVLE